jgi:hypothetical protein
MAPAGGGRGVQGRGAHISRARHRCGRGGRKGEGSGGRRTGLSAGSLREPSRRISCTAEAPCRSEAPEIWRRSARTGGGLRRCAVRRARSARALSPGSAVHRPRAHGFRFAPRTGTRGPNDSTRPGGERRRNGGTLGQDTGGAAHSTPGRSLKGPHVLDRGGIPLLPGVFEPTPSCLRQDPGVPQRLARHWGRNGE